MRAPADNVATAGTRQLQSVTVTGYRAVMPGPRPRGDHALTPAERSAAYRERRKAAGGKQAWVRDPAAAPTKPLVVVKYRRLADRRSKPAKWQDAVETLLDVLDEYQAWRDNLPAALADSAIADRLDEVLALRDLVDQLAAAELPKGFGRD